MVSFTRPKQIKGPAKRKRGASAKKAVVSEVEDGASMKATSDGFPAWSEQYTYSSQQLAFDPLLAAYLEGERNPPPIFERDPNGTGVNEPLEVPPGEASSSSTRSCSSGSDERAVGNVAPQAASSRDKYKYPRGPPRKRVVMTPVYNPESPLESISHPSNSNPLGSSSSVPNDGTSLDVESDGGHQNEDEGTIKPHSSLKDSISVLKVVEEQYATGSIAESVNESHASAKKATVTKAASSVEIFAYHKMKFGEEAGSMRVAELEAREIPKLNMATWTQPTIEESHDVVWLLHVDNVASATSTLRTDSTRSNETSVVEDLTNLTESRDGADMSFRMDEHTQYLINLLETMDSIIESLPDKEPLRLFMKENEQMQALSSSWPTRAVDLDIIKFAFLLETGTSFDDSLNSSIRSQFGSTFNDEIMLTHANLRYAGDLFNSIVDILLAPGKKLFRFLVLLQTGVYLKESDQPGSSQLDLDFKRSEIFELYASMLTSDGKKYRFMEEQPAPSDRPHTPPNNPSPANGFYKDERTGVFTRITSVKRSGKTDPSSTEKYRCYCGYIPRGEEKWKASNLQRHKRVAHSSEEPASYKSTRNTRPSESLSDLGFYPENRSKRTFELTDLESADDSDGNGAEITHPATGAGQASKRTFELTDLESPYHSDGNGAEITHSSTGSEQMPTFSRPKGSQSFHEQWKFSQAKRRKRARSRSRSFGSPTMLERGGIHQPPPTAHDLDRLRYHIDLQDFGKGVQEAASAVFSTDRRSRYTQVSALLISWEDEDPQLPVSIEINALKAVFVDLYGFAVEEYQIPPMNSHKKLTRRILDFFDDENSKHLKIVYYAGHGKLSAHGQSVWTR